jgi:hypothetical protein
MPWELNIVKTVGKPPQKSPETKDTHGLGVLPAIQRQLSNALPGIEFYKEPSGEERLAAMKEQGIEIPDSLKSIFARTKGSYRGIYKGDDFSFEFCFGHETTVDHAFLDVRGSGEPLPALQHLMLTTGWAIYDLASSKLVESKGWEKFTEWRDRCIDRIKEDGRPHE